MIENLFEIILSKTGVSLSITCIFIYFIFILPYIPELYFNNFKNPILTIFLFILLIIFSKENKILSIFFLIFLTITYSYIYISKYNRKLFENFDNIRKDSLLYPILKRNKLKVPEQLWSSSNIGTKLGLNK